ncbi:MAG: hypothetical protein AAFN94_17680 [Pseudomonadota bacterium]
MFAPLSSQAQALTDLARAFVLRIRPYKSAPPLALSVTGGMHDACNAQLRRDAIRIGAGDGCDFVLLDPEVADHHADIAVSYSLIGPLATIHAVGGDVTLDGSTIAAGDTSRHRKLPLTLSIADGVTLHLQKPQRSTPTLSPVERFMRRLTTTMALLGSVTIGLLVWDTFFSARIMLQPNPAAFQTDEETVSGVDMPTFMAKLEEMGLADALSVTETPDGIRKVTGRLTPQKAQQWSAFTQWYDTVSFANPMVVQLESTEELPQMPPVAIVRLSEPKEIILKTGETMATGSIFSGAWKVAAIEPDHIVIARGADTEKLLFARPANE